MDVLLPSCTVDFMRKPAWAWLTFVGVTTWVIADPVPIIANDPLLKFLKRHVRVPDRLRGNAFWVRERVPATGKLERMATPLVLAPVLLFMGSKSLLVVIIGKIPAAILVSSWKTRWPSAAVGAA